MMGRNQSDYPKIFVFLQVKEAEDILSQSDTNWRKKVQFDINSKYLCSIPTSQSLTNETSLYLPKTSRLEKKTHVYEVFHAEREP